MKTYVRRIFTMLSRRILLRIRNVSDKKCRQIQNTQFTLINFFESLAVYEIMWKNMIQPDRTQITI